MRIPKQFELFGTTIKVEFDNKKCHQDSVYGWAIYEENKIVLSDEAKNIERDESDIESTFWHEVFHIMMSKLDYDKLSNDEQLMSLMGRAMQQIMNTMEYADTN